jgi:nucleoside-diphosphate-sugar epimerase
VARYLVTGGAGFIGSHLVETLLAQRNEVAVLDTLSTGRLSNLDAVKDNPGFTFVQGSVLDELAVDTAVRGSDVVVHLAAAVGVKLIVEQPLYSLTTNIKGAITVLEAAHRYRRKVMVASTSEIYGKNNSGPLNEQSDRILGSPAVARWAYSTSKAVDEILAYAYHRERDLPTIVVRLFNTVGPRQSPAYGMVVPRLVHQALNGTPLTVYGDGAQTRCFCHVTDVVDALVRLLNEPSAVGDVFNIGSSEEISIEHLARLIIDKTGSPSSIIHVPYDVAYETGFEDMARRVPDVRKLESLTGWHAQRSLTQVLDDVIDEVRCEVGPGAVTATSGERLAPGT